MKVKTLTNNILHLLLVFHSYVDDAGRTVSWKYSFITIELINVTTEKLFEILSRLRLLYNYMRMICNGGLSVIWIPRKGQKIALVLTLLCIRLWCF